VAGGSPQPLKFWLCEPGCGFCLVVHNHPPTKPHHRTAPPLPLFLNLASSRHHRLFVSHPTQAHRIAWGDFRQHSFGFALRRTWMNHSDLIHLSHTRLLQSPNDALLVYLATRPSPHRRHPSTSAFALDTTGHFQYQNRRPIVVQLHQLTAGPLSQHPPPCSGPALSSVPLALWPRHGSPPTRSAKSPRCKFYSTIFRTVSTPSSLLVTRLLLCD